MKVTPASSIKNQHLLRYFQDFSYSIQIVVLTWMLGRIVCVWHGISTGASDLGNVIEGRITGSSLGRRTVQVTEAC